MGLGRCDIRVLVLDPQRQVGSDVVTLQVGTLSFLHSMLWTQMQTEESLSYFLPPAPLVDGHSLRPAKDS